MAPFTSTAFLGEPASSCGCLPNGSLEEVPNNTTSKRGGWLFVWEAAKRAGRVAEERDGRRTTRSSTQHHTTPMPHASRCARARSAPVSARRLSAERSRPWHARVRGASASEARPRPRHVRGRGASASEARPRPLVIWRVRVRAASASAGVRVRAASASAGVRCPGCPRPLGCPSGRPPGVRVHGRL